MWCYAVFTWNKTNFRSYYVFITVNNLISVENKTKIIQYLPSKFKKNRGLN